MIMLAVGQDQLQGAPFAGAGPLPVDRSGSASPALGTEPWTKNRPYPGCRTTAFWSPSVMLCLVQANNHTTTKRSEQMHSAQADLSLAAPWHGVQVHARHSSASGCCLQRQIHAPLQEIKRWLLLELLGHWCVPQQVLQGGREGGGGGPDGGYGGKVCCPLQERCCTAMLMDCVRLPCHPPSSRHRCG